MTDTIRLPRDAQIAFAKALLNPPAPTQALIELMRRDRPDNLSPEDFAAYNAIHGIDK